MFVAVAEVFDAYAINVLVIGGASDVDLAKVDEFLKVVFVLLGPGLHRRASNVHGPLADLAILLAEEVVWVALWLFLCGKIMRAGPAILARQPAQCWSHELRM